MALLGNGGILELSREWPEPMALSIGALNYTSSPRTLALDNENYWTGDRVLLDFPGGSPYGTGNPDGFSVYFGGFFLLSPARAHVTGPNARYYKDDNSVLFYNNTALQRITTGYIYSDQLGRIRLFNTEIGARNADPADEIALQTLQTTNFVLTRYSDNPTYTSAVATAANSIQPISLPSTSQPLRSVITPPPDIAAIADDPAERGWLFQADLQEWALDIDAANLDMTAIGETFGENTKALVRGAGSLQFLLEQRDQDEGQDSLTLLRLVLLTQKGCKSNAKFWLYKDRNDNCGRVGGSVYYQCDLLLTNSRINTRADELITGSTDFVVTGEIAIRITA